MLLHDPQEQIEVHLWKCNLNFVNLTQQKIEILSDIEKLRSQQFLTETDKNNFILSHWFLRTILSLYVQDRPHEIKFIQGKNSKPVLKNKQLRERFSFNFSRSEHYALVAISNLRTLGVDIERIKPLGNGGPIMENYFSKSEMQMVRSEKNEQSQLKLFYSLWTMKEAVTKALATGITVNISAYDIANFVHHHYGCPTFDRKHNWWIGPLYFENFCAAALAVRTPDTTAPTIHEFNVA